MGNPKEELKRQHQQEPKKEDNKKEGRLLTDVINESDRVLMITAKGSSIEIHDIKNVKQLYEARGLLLTALKIYEANDIQRVVKPVKDQLVGILTQVMLGIREVGKIVDEKNNKK